MTSRVYRQVYTRLIAFTRAVGARVIRIIQPFSKEEDLRRREYILNVILAISIIFLCILEGTIVCNYIIIKEYNGLSPVYFGGLIVFCLILFATSKRGYARLASHILIFTFTAGTIYGGWIWGMSLPPILLTTSLVIVTSSVLIGSSFGFISTFIMILVLILLGIHEKYVLHIPEWHYSEISYTDMITYATIFAFISFIAWLSNREISKSLYRARTSERLLEKERNILEERVAERTKAFITSEEDRMRRLEESSQLGNLSKGLLHDLMNPLSSISLYIEHLSKDDSLPKQTCCEVQKIAAISSRMSSYMQSLKNHLRNNQSEYTEGKTDMRTELDTLRDIFGFKARMLGVQLNFGSPEKPLIINTNPIRTHQLFSNLVSNALEACERIPITQSNQQHEININIINKSRYLIITVTDTGCGIDPKIFEKISYRSCTTKRDGLGIGLLTVRDIVEKDLNGYMTISSIKGKGSIFNITIPYDKYSFEE